MTKREIRLFAVACTFIGIVIGFLLSPIKAGITCGNNNNTLTQTEPPERK